MQFIQGTEPTKVCTTPTRVQSVQVPSVIGLDQETATVLLEEAGFFVEARLEVSTQPPGTVIYQGPAAGTRATQTGVATITVSTGDAEPPAPDAPG